MTNTPGPKKNGTENSATVALIAEELGVPLRTVFHRLAQARDFDALPAPLRDAVEAGDTTIKDAKTEHRNKAAAEDRKARAQAAAKATVGDDQNVIHGDFRELGDRVKDNSVSLIFTDPRVGTVMCANSKCR